MADGLGQSLPNVDNTTKVRPRSGASHGTSNVTFTYMEDGILSKSLRGRACGDDNMVSTKERSWELPGLDGAASPPNAFDGVPPPAPLDDGR